MIKTLIVGTDGSDHAQHAVAFAAQLARQLNAKVVLVHVAGPFPPLMASAGGYMTYTPQGVIDETRAALETRVREEFGAPLAEARVPWQSRVVTGSAPTALSEVATEVGAQLLIVGTRGLHGLGEFFLGSTSHALTHHSSLPVIVVPLPPSEVKQAPRTAALAPAVV